MTDKTNPSHYRAHGRKECIDVIRESLGDEGFVAFCVGNSIKYRYRAGTKDGETRRDCLAKAEWYRKMSGHVLDPQGCQDPRRYRES
jgi:hypothetical protein